MKTGSIGNIRVEAAKGTKNIHNFSHNLYTSCGFGEVSPTKCLHCKPDSKTNLKEEFLCYLADINAPTYGHVSVNFWHYFVEYEDLFSIFPQLLAQTPVYNVGRDMNDPNNNGMVVPQQLPWVPRNLLSLMPLVGAHMTVYKVTGAAGNNRTIQMPVWAMNNASQSNGATAEYLKLRSDIKNYIVAKYGGDGNLNDYLSRQGVRINGMDLGVDTLAIDVRALVDNSLLNYAGYMRIPLGNPNDHSIGEHLDASGAVILEESGIDVAPVSIQSADFIIEREFNIPNVITTSDRYIFAFRMHAFGKRLYKIMKGLEFQEDFTAIQPCSIAPFMATFKAYWHSFGLEYYENYENTYCAMISRLFDSTGGQMKAFHMLFAEDGTINTLTAEDKIAMQYVKGFLFHLGTMWYTEAQDYVSAQQHEITNSASVDATFVRSFTPLQNAIGVGNVNPVLEPNTNGANPTDTLGTNNHAYIDNVLHGELSAEILKKLYLYTNRNTIAGKRVRELLEMQGLGKWADAQRIRFIGHDSKDVDFDQVVSTANTFDGLDGDLLGGRGGRGQAYHEGGSHYYHNDNEGFLITLIAVIPDAGYTQVMNNAFECLKKFDFYQHDFDGKGYEATRIKYINGERPIKLLDATTGAEPVDDTERVFGFAPRMSKFKYAANILSGHFAKRSTRDYFLTYCTDKFIDVGEVNTTYEGNTGSLANGDFRKVVTFGQIFPFDQFPLAGPHWRFTTRYPWLGHFERIFANLGDSTKVAANDALHGVEFLIRAWEYLNNEEDGFSIMATIKIRQRNDMLQIADSYETTDDSNEGHTNMNTSKA